MRIFPMPYFFRRPETCLLTGFLRMCGHMFPGPPAAVRSRGGGIVPQAMTGPSQGSLSKGARHGQFVRRGRSRMCPSRSSVHFAAGLRR